MSVISTLIEPHRVTRVFLDCCDTTTNPADQRRIATWTNTGMTRAAHSKMAVKSTEED